ncbi:YxlC family protein [Paenibacillus pinihumi]|uniref:YxlC family protein n=1 Tax=Paenibacillus pinihumi TaxID=669462 RepID=UPI0004010849|nr:YxlC family protein [Paenibacillus pinihumi]
MNNKDKENSSKAAKGLQTEQELKSDLAKMEEWFPVYTPDISWFETRLAAGEKKLRRKKNREWAFFYMLAVVILGSIIAVGAANPIYFICIQLLGLVIVPAVIRYEKRKRVV